MLLLRRLNSKHQNDIKMQISGVIILIAEILSFGHTAEGLGPAALAIIPALITSGGSFLGSTLPGALSGDPIIQVNITVENWTRFPMTNPSIRPVAGSVDLLPRNIEPGTKEIMVARKTRFTATGSYGTVSWLVDVNGQRQRIVVMWSVPYDYNWYSNWLAVGITNTVTHPAGGLWYDNMYNRDDTPNNDFNRKKFRNNLDDLVFNLGRFEIVARMGNGHKTQVTVEVRPARDADLADNLGAALG